MTRLVKDDGFIKPGIIKEAITCVNYRDYKLETPMGRPLPGVLKNIRFNQFHFIGVMGPEVMVGLAVVDLKLIASGFFYVFDRIKNVIIESGKLQPFGRNVSIGLNPDTPASFFHANGLHIKINDNRVMVRAKEMALELKLDVNRVNPLRLCTRTGYRGWVYTQKTTPLPLKGSLEYNGEKKELHSPDYMGVSDWTAGFMRRHTFWNWASTASVIEDGRSLGLNLSMGVNETGFTENAFWIDNVMTKVDLVNFVFDQNDLLSPWQIRSSDRRVHLDFFPENHRKEKIQAGFLASRFTQVLGVFSGYLVAENGEKIRVENCPGWTEDHYAKW